MVLGREALALFQVAPAGGAVAVTVGGVPLVALTPPRIEDISREMPILRAAADLRADRMAEILSQQGDLLSFFGAQQWLSATRRQWTLLFLGAVYAAVSAVEMGVKHLCSVPRAIDLSPLIQPVIQTPGHSSYPSGHSTEAHAFAVALACLRLAAAEADAAGASVAGSGIASLMSWLPAAEGAPVPPGPADFLTLLFRLSARIADNRTVAGVHFPVDSAHGALLGLGCTLAIIAHAAGGGSVPAFHARGQDWARVAEDGTVGPRDFTLREWRAALAETGPLAWHGSDTVTLPAPGVWHSLPVVWQAAVAEWRNGG